SIVDAANKPSFAARRFIKKSAESFDLRGGFRTESAASPVNTLKLSVPPKLGDGSDSGADENPKSTKVSLPRSHGAASLTGNASGDFGRGGGLGASPRAGGAGGEGGVSSRKDRKPGESAVAPSRRGGRGGVGAWLLGCVSSSFVPSTEISASQWRH